MLDYILFELLEKENIINDQKILFNKYLEFKINKPIFLNGDKNYLIKKHYYIIDLQTLYVYGRKMYIDNIKEDGFSIKFMPIKVKTVNNERIHITFFNILDLLIQPQNQDYLSDSTKEYIKNFLFDVEKDILKKKPIKQKNDYFSIPSTAITKIIKQFLNNPKRIENSKKNQLITKEHYLTKDTIITYKSKVCTFTLTVARTKELFNKNVKNGAKIFNFLLQKLNEQNYMEETSFLLKELIDANIYSNKDSAYRGLKVILDKMAAIEIEGTFTKYEKKNKGEEIRNIKAPIIGQRDVSYNRCFVYFPPIIRNYAPFITILPYWSYKLGESAYILLDYIFYVARQRTERIKTKQNFTLKLETVRKHMGIISPQETNRHQQLIFEPIENAITEIEQKQEGTDIKITPIYTYEYKNIQEYLDGYLQIELDKIANNYINNREIQKHKKISKKAKKSKTY